MLAINTNSNYFIENQPSVAKELLESLKKLFNDFIGEKIANQRFENLKKDFMFLTNEAHRLNAEIEIIREKLNNHLINHIYDSNIHEELSNNYDSSFCPHCQNKHIIKYGKDNKGNQRYLCKECSKTFSSITGSLLSYTKKQPYQWFEYIQSLNKKSLKP